MYIQIDKPCLIHGRGSRDHQEDAYAPVAGLENPRNRVFAVCDGMGGHEHGEVASRIVAEGLVNGYETFMGKDPSPDNFLSLFHEVRQQLDAHPFAMEGIHRMGTTLTFVALTTHGILAAHLGDSVIYVIRPGRITDLVYRSADHSLTYRLTQLKQLTPVQVLTHAYRNQLDKAVQPFGEDDPDVRLITDIRAGDYIMLCTDGVMENLTDEMVRFIFAPYRTPSEIADLITRHCSLSSDNHTALILPVVEVDDTDRTYIVQDDRIPEPEGPQGHPVGLDKIDRDIIEGREPLSMGITTDPYGGMPPEDTSKESESPVSLPEKEDVETIPSGRPKLEGIDYSGLRDQTYRSDSLLEEVRTKEL